MRILSLNFYVNLGGAMTITPNDQEEEKKKNCLEQNIERAVCRYTEKEEQRKGKQKKEKAGWKASSSRTQAASLDPRFDFEGFLFPALRHS